MPGAPPPFPLIARDGLRRRSRPQQARINAVCVGKREVRAFMGANRVYVGTGGARR